MTLIPDVDFITVAKPIQTTTAPARRFRTSAARPVQTTTAVKRRFRTQPIWPIPSMPQGNDFSPIDPDETITGTFDFGRWLPTGVTITSVATMLCEVYSGTDAGAAGRLIGGSVVATSPLTGAASAAVLQQYGTMLAGVVYRLTAEINTSDNQKLVLYAHMPCKARA